MDFVRTDTLKMLSLEKISDSRNLKAGKIWTEALHIPHTRPALYL